jgi:hypothetical protein
MGVSREHILEEVKRTAQANGGSPLGHRAFLVETGIRETDWKGSFWARWNDVLKEAGFGPNKLTEAIEDEVLLTRYAKLASELGRLPVDAELRLKKRADSSFPSSNVFARFGGKAQLLLRLQDYCSGKPEYTELLEQIETELGKNEVSASESQQPAESIDGFVYLVKMGKPLQDW